MIDYLVVGGGIIGLSIAERLATAKQSVRVLDFSPPGGTASWSASGILPPPISKSSYDPIESLRDLSHRLYPAWVEQLSSKKLDLELERCGGIYVARNPGESLSLNLAADDWEKDGVEVISISREHLSELEPSLNLSNVKTAFLLPGEYQVRPPRILKALAQSLQDRGVEIEQVRTPTQLEIVNGECLATIDGIPSRTRALILANGPWSTDLLLKLGLNIGVEPRRGQMVMWKLPRRAIHHIINEGPRYLVCRKDGTLLAGSTVEDVGFENMTTAEGIQQLVDFAIGWMPALANVGYSKAWSGLRPASRDGAPLIGKVQGIRNLYLATGHFRSGIHLAPATAECIVREVMDQPSLLDMSDFAPRRN